MWTTATSSAPNCPAARCSAPWSSLREIVRTTQPHRIVVGMFERRNRMPVGELLELRFAGNVIEEAANTYERVCGRVCLKEIRPVAADLLRRTGPAPATTCSTSGSPIWSWPSSGIVLSSPIMLLTALAVRLSSPGPVLYRQTRVGLDGALFTVYKFRSMRADAEARHGRRLGAEGRSARDPRGPHHPPHPLRRAAAALQRAQGRDVDRRPAPRAPRVRAGAERADSLLPAAPLRAARHHRLGADQLQIRRHPARTPSPSWNTTSTTSRTCPWRSTTTSSFTP